jgi:hypothetical protein
MAGGTSPFVNVADYGAKGDGTSDDTEALQAAIAAAAPSATNPSGNSVFLPAGNYLVTSSLSLPPAVNLLGAGWNIPGAGGPLLGSWVFVEAGASFSPLEMAGNGAAVRNLGFNVVNQSTKGPPASAAAMVHIAANNALVEDICLYNPYAGIFLDGGAQVSIRRVFGQPLSYGIKVDRSLDTNYIDTLHFWPYWQPAASAAGAFQLANGNALELLRCDNPQISNVFAYNYAAGLFLGSSPAGTAHKVHLQNADFDTCVTGLDIAAPGQAGLAATLQMSNVTVQAPAGAGAPKGNGIWVEPGSDYAMLQASNLRVGHSGLNAIRLDAANVRFYGENVSLEHWGGNAGFYISQGSSVAWLGAGFAYTPGSTPYAPARQFHMARLT